MSTRLVALVTVTVLVLGIGPTAAASTTAQPASGSVNIVAVYPNPVANGDAGEFVVLEADRAMSLDNWTVSDGEDTVRLANITVDGRVVLSTAPNRTRNLTAGPVRALGGALALANGGDSLTLARNEEVVATLSWESAPEGSIGRPGGGGGELDWQPVGASDFPAVDAGPGQVRSFVLPDAGGFPADVLASADRRILLGGYTLTAEHVVNVLRNASQRGVRVVVLVDGEPVGGMTRREARMLDSLVAAGVRVRVLGGSGAPYAFHHAKYAVVDDRALVTTENWKPAGVGGHSSRGWGVVVGTDRIVDGLARTFRTDGSGRGVQSWEVFGANTSFEPADAPPANATYPSQFRPEQVRATSVTLLVAPDNAERRLVARIDNASESIRVQQVSVGSRRQPFLRATLRAARRGVDVDILLSGAWYVREDNRALVRWLNDLAAREGLPLDARLAEPRGRYEKTHAKGVVVDESVVVGSLNWNNHSARENREVVLVLSGQNVTQYYRRVFRADWQGGSWRLPAGLVVLTVLCWLVAALVGRRFEFERPRP